MNVHPIRSDGCLSYLLVSGSDAVVIDPALDTKKYQEAVAAAGATLRFVIDTHTHADHLSGARRLADQAGARLVMSRAARAQWAAASGQADALGIGDILRRNGGIPIDIEVGDGDALELGSEGLTFRDVPGHTLDSVVVVADQRIFTGDTLHINQAGRADLPGGDGAALYDALFQRLTEFPDETFVYPGHDYEGQTVTALGLERARNPFLRPRSKAEFLAYLATAFPSLTGAGMQCGANAVSGSGGLCADPLRDEVAGFMDGLFFQSKRAEDYASTAELQARLAAGKPTCVLDVREPQEYAGGRIRGAVNISVHQLDGRLEEIPFDRNEPIYAVCRSGKRSGWATMFLRVAGFRDVRNVEGGMLDWEARGFDVERDPQRSSS